MRRKDDAFLKHEVNEITFYVLFGILVAIVLPIVAGFGLKAFEETFITGRPLQFGDEIVKFIVYYILIFGALIGLPVLKIREIIFTNPKEHPANQSKPTLFSTAIIHDPEQDGALWAMSDALGFKGNKNLMRWSHSILRNFLLAIVLFSIVGIFQVATQTVFSDVPQVAQQVTGTSRVLLTAEPASFAETNFMLFLYAIFMGFNSYICSRFKLGRGSYFALGFFICFIIGGLWVGFHLIVYGNDAAALFSTFIFGTVGAMFTLLFGTFIYWYVWHFMNNSFYEIGEVTTSNADVIFLTVIGVVALIAVWAGSEFLLRKFKRMLGYVPPEPKVI